MNMVGLMTEDLKRCPRCTEWKQQTEFVRNRAQRDGLDPYCKPCRYAAARVQRERYPEKFREAGRRYAKGKRPVRTQAQMNARAAVDRALRRGTLVRPSICPACGKDTSPIEAHHHDYQQPLAIEWMCARCHRRHHAAQRKALK